jgi:hypothetical protein
VFDTRAKEVGHDVTCSRFNVVVCNAMVPGFAALLERAQFGRLTMLEPEGRREANQAIRRREPLPDWTGTAAFTQEGRFRQELERDWTPNGVQPRTVLWIGMNPSTANGEQNDPTCQREHRISVNRGFTRYLKGNVLDIVETVPDRVPLELDAARSAGNIAAIGRLAARAQQVILVCGDLDREFWGDAVGETLATLRRTHNELFCFRVNRSGWPTHTLYVRNDAQLLVYAGQALRADQQRQRG